MKFQLVARNGEHLSESYLFHTVDTKKEAIEYARSKKQAFFEAGNWLIEIEDVKNNTLVAWDLELVKA